MGRAGRLCVNGGPRDAGKGSAPFSAWHPLPSQRGKGMLRMPLLCRAAPALLPVHVMRGCSTTHLPPVRVCKPTAPCQGSSSMRRAFPALSGSGNRCAACSSELALRLVVWLCACLSCGLKKELLGRICFVSTTAMHSAYPVPLQPCTPAGPVQERGLLHSHQKINGTSCQHGQATADTDDGDGGCVQPRKARKCAMRGTPAPMPALLPGNVLVHILWRPINPSDIMWCA